MRRTLLAAFLPGALLLGLSTAHALDEALKAKAREVLEKHKDAVVSVKVVVSMSYAVGMGEGLQQTHKQENKAEVPGVVVDPGGLTMVGDPSANFGMDEDEDLDVGGGDKVQLKPKIDITDVKLVLGDGTELAADVVLRDKDLGLGFVRPKDKPAQPLPHVAFAKTEEPKEFDELITLRRLSRALDRTRCVVVVDENAIQAVLKKPRTLYVGGAMPGTPVFNRKGEPIGVGVMLRNPVRDRNLFSYGGETVILPSEDVHSGD